MCFAPFSFACSRPSTQRVRACVSVLCADCDAGAVMNDALDASPIPEAVCREYFRDAVEGLHYLHFQGIVHCDLKPANLLVSSHARSESPVQTSKTVARSSRASIRTASSSEDGASVQATSNVTCKVADLGCAFFVTVSNPVSLSRSRSRSLTPVLFVGSAACWLLGHAQLHTSLARVAHCHSPKSPAGRRLSRRRNCLTALARRQPTTFTCWTALLSTCGRSASRSLPC